MMQNQEVRDFLNRYPKVQTIELLLPDQNGILRGKRIEIDLLDKVYQTGCCLPASVMSLNSRGASTEEAGLGLAHGDRDYVCKPIEGTLAIVPWVEDLSRAQVLCTMLEDDGSPMDVVPRNILVKTNERFSTLGYKVGIALELEFYLLDTERTENGGLQPPKSPASGHRMSSTQVYAMQDLADHNDFIEEVISAAHMQNIPADTVIAEYAPGQFEVNLNYGDDVVAAADQALLLKRVITSIAKKRGMQATFMAKPYLEEAGNGLHMHLSLMDESGTNVFASEPPTDNPLLQYAVAGLLDMADSCQALWSPNVNSFKRLASRSFAPTSKTWGYDNRSVAMRIPSGSLSSTRIEHRMAGADANPYLATSALLAGVFHGITEKMTAPEPVTGDAYKQDHPHVADNQRDSLRLMESDPRISDWFGAEFIRVFSAVKWDDVNIFEQQISALEHELLLPYI